MANNIEIKTEVLALAKAFMPSHYNLKVFKTSTKYSYENEFGEGHYDLQPGEPILEGTCGEHWSPAWKKICSKYLLADGTGINPDALPEDIWVDIQTHPDANERRKSITWVLDPMLVSSEPFEVNGLRIDPNVDMLCMGGDEQSPTLEWGGWPVKKEVFKKTYESL